MRTTIKHISLGLVAVMAATACSDDFLQEKKNYDQVGAEVYEYYSGANGRLNDLYGWCLPTVSDISWKYPSMGNNDIAAKSTEEYAGFSDFVNPEVELTSMGTTNGVPDYYMGQANNIQEAVYGRIRNINDFIRGVSESDLSQEDKDKLLGQAYFFRAWCYYNVWKWYGGVPIVKTVLNPTTDVHVDRSTSKEVYEFILDDLQQSADMLRAETANGGWRTSTDYGRVTSGTALALKGRVMLLWASPLFNRKNDQSRWTAAYQQMKADLATIDACGYGLFSTGSNFCASDFANIFTQQGRNPEAVFFTQYNTTAILTGIDDAAKNNAWERYIRPDNCGGNGLGASQMMVNLFPMADGRIPAGTGTYTKLETSSQAYEEEFPFMNRDPRFYRTFAFPGFRWAYAGDASAHDAHNPSDGQNYVLWNYVWYTDLNDQGNPESGNSYAADNLLGSKQGIYVRKKSDDLDINSSPLYVYNANGWKSGAGPFYSAAPLIELRYAEVLLNLAEAACGANDMAYAVELLQKIRQRAGYDATTGYGLQSNLASDQATCMSAILYERQIELAYEGKRFDDMRRWMLFDGGQQKVEGQPESWNLTGWGGNTCTWLGFKPFNGQRRETLEFRVADKYGVGTQQWDGDPLLANGGVRCEGVNFSKGDVASQLDTLKSWYQDNLVVKVRKGDGRDSQHNDEYISFRAKYYLLGLGSGAQNQNKRLPQTIGWEDYNNGGSNGTFDPLAE
mgnify:CR=1 FL=1